VLRQNAWLIALLAYMLVSTLWSDIPLSAFKRWTREAIVVIMVLVVLSEADPRQALESLLRRCAYILIPFSVILIRYYPRLGREYTHWSGKETWIGVTVHKNSLGCVCLVTGFFLVWELYRRWKKRSHARWKYQGWADLAVLFLTLYLLKGAENAYSATAIGAFAVGIAAFLTLLWLRKQKLRIPLPALLSLVGFLIWFGTAAPFLGGSNLATFSSSLGRDATLTGRTETWAQLVPVVEREPLLGCGFGSFWTTARREFYRMSYGHNGYLDTLLEIGAVGLALFSAWFLSSARKLHRALARDYEWASFAICLLVMALVYNATESALTLADPIIAVVALTSFMVCNESIYAFRRSRLSLRLHVPA
jgi:O-antigen ligase